MYRAAQRSGSNEGLRAGDAEFSLRLFPAHYLILPSSKGLNNRRIVIRNGLRGMCLTDRAGV